MPKEHFRKTTYRRALPYLLRDFMDRCAYSMQHLRMAGGKLEVDHFNPTKKKQKVQRYSNLFPASRHCNGAKSDAWPSDELQELGVRYLDCTKEHDYGEQIFEDPETNELVGATPGGKYHIRKMDLNAAHLVAERRDRARLWEKVNSAFIWQPGQEAKMEALLSAVRQQAELMIPPIPPLPEEDESMAS